jgi:hypothetical protein
MCLKVKNLIITGKRLTFVQFDRDICFFDGLTI